MNKYNFCKICKKDQVFTQHKDHPSRWLCGCCKFATTIDVINIDEDNMDRIEMTYKAIDEIVECHGNPKPERFGGGLWDSREEFEVYKRQVGRRYTEHQWSIITSYFETKLKEKEQ